METWKLLEKYNNEYMVSSNGRVKSLKFGKNKLLKSNPDGHGYLCVKLYCNGKKINIAVHRLVAIAFLNHEPCGHKWVIDHIDNNHLNNKVENLQITTNRYNSSKDRRGYSSKYVGVSWSTEKSKWKSCIQIKGIHKHIGYFDNEHDAHLAYQKELAKIN